MPVLGNDPLVSREPVVWREIESPLGPILLLGEAGHLTGLHFEERRWGPQQIDPAWQEDDQAFDDVRVQLTEYFDGTRRSFDLAIAPAGTEFQQRVWTALVDIPYGDTATYGALARSLDTPAASRAVGAANGQNPISIIVPCHRLVGADGSLTGYGGGLDRKRWLLDHESGSGSGAVSETV